MLAKFCIAVSLSCGAAIGQAPANPAPAAKALAFDVVSIREDKGPPAFNPDFGPTPDGYRITNGPLMLPLLTAFVPAGDSQAFFTDSRVIGIPDWAKTARFDIDAKIADQDAAEWQKPASQRAMLQTMLQQMFADRCKIAVHREMKEGPVYFLVLGKGGPKFKETNPEETHTGMHLPFGGVLAPNKDGMNLQEMPMTSFASLLAEFLNTGRPVLDKTGLAGKYDIVLKLDGMVRVQGGQQDGGAPDPGGGFSSIVESLGLKLEPGRAVIETLVIDHMERPSEN
jgi:bla regulator protein blaR1